VTLLNSEPEIQFIVLRNINIMLQKRPFLLSADAKVFFCKYNDPPYVKLEKMDVMVRLVDERSLDAVIHFFSPDLFFIIILI